MMRPAAEGQVVDVGLFGLGPLSHVVHLGQIAGHIAARCCTSAVLGGLIDPPIAYARPVGELVRCTNGACMVHPCVPESGTLTERRLSMRFPPRQRRLPADHDDRGLH
jgi:hypothetical protein